MSSKSPIPEKANVVVVGNFWTAPLFAKHFHDAGEKVACLILERPSESAPFPDELFITIGNGEYFESACRIFGEAVATELWAFSSRNYERAKRLFDGSGLSYREQGTLWYARDLRERVLIEQTAKRLPRDRAVLEKTRLGTREFVALLHEPGICFSPHRLGEALSQSFETLPVKTFESVTRAGLDVTIRFDGSAITAPIVIIAAQLFPPALLPSFADKWLQVTLGSFLFPPHAGLEFSLAIFNGGADFAVNQTGGVRLGSFRNLYMDKAVGIHPQPDPVTLQGVSRFFSELGWIKQGEVPHPHVEVQTLSCDGLPLVGALPDLPGVYLVAGMAGRMQNFLFEVAPALADGILRDAGFDKLRLFSTKRFV